MKRPVQEVAGGPTLRARRPGGVGPTVSDDVFDIVACSPDLRDPMSTAAADAALLADFIAFLSDEDPPDLEGVSEPDVDFEARLRSRLWRNHVMTRLRDGDGPH